MDLFGKRALERLQFIAIKSLAVFGEGTEEGGRIPVRWLAGGEWEVAREVEQLKANLWVVVTRLEVVGRVVVGFGRARRRGCSSTAVLRRSRARKEWPVSYTGARQSYWWAWEGRGGATAVDWRRAEACRSWRRGRGSVHRQ